MSESTTRGELCLSPGVAPIGAVPTVSSPLTAPSRASRAQASRQVARQRQKLAKALKSFAIEENLADLALAAVIVEADLADPAQDAPRVALGFAQVAEVLLRDLSTELGAFFDQMSESPSEVAWRARVLHQAASLLSLTTQSMVATAEAAEQFAAVPALGEVA